MRVEDHVDAMLDYALEMTFPASDPFTVYCPDAAINEPAAEPQCKPTGAA
jgi:hypothetical protein